MSSAAASPWVQVYRARKRTKATLREYSLDNWFAVIPMHETAAKRILFWIEPRENLRDVEGLMDAAYEKYGSLVEGRPPIGYGQLAPTQLHFAYLTIHSIFIPMLVQHTFIHLDDVRRLSDFRNASVTAQADLRAWGTIDLIRGKNCVQGNVLELLDSSSAISLTMPSSDEVLV